MTHTTMPTTMPNYITHEQFAKSLLTHLDASCLTVSPDIIERLRFARERAVNAQKIATTQTALAMQSQRQATGSLAMGGSANSNLDHLGGGFNFDVFSKWSSLIPLAALVIGLFTINHFQSDMRAKEVADIDAALLTDDLPPAAYADQGFGQFLKLQLGR